MYNECIQFTRQFAFCPNVFRIDLYKGCDFGCSYCFANMDWQKEKCKGNWKQADFNRIEKIFYKALETDKQSKDILVELIRHRVPIHCGGMSDPFQKREFEAGLTYRLIQLSNQYKYPIQFSTKAAELPEKYLDSLDPDIHAFQFSIMGWSEEFIRKWEKNTPLASDRLKMLLRLRRKGIWAGIRIQPLISVDEALKLVYEAQSAPNYYTIEHFKLVYDTEQSKMAFLSLCPDKQNYLTTDHKLQLRRDLKMQNIYKIQEAANKFGVLVGVGDNDLHYLSQSRCCCGLDTCPEAFQNYLKYNLTYMVTGEMEQDTFIPACNPRKHINDQKYGSIIDCKQYAEDYIKSHPDYLGNRRAIIEKSLFGYTKKRLF